jgi:hypothetical protein
MGHYSLINSVCPKAGVASMPDIIRVASTETGAVRFFMVLQSPLFVIARRSKAMPLRKPVCEMLVKHLVIEFRAQALQASVHSGNRIIAEEEDFFIRTTLS